MATSLKDVGRKKEGPMKIGDQDRKEDVLMPICSI
jgi:hypothetical protein